MLRPLATALLGVALCLAGATFDTASLYVPGVALVAIAAGATAWVLLAANGATVERRAGPASVVEEEPYPLRIEATAGALPPPGGELVEPLLGWPVAVAGRWSRRVRINVRFSRRGRRVLEPGRLVIRDPLRLFTREVVGATRDEVLVLPRIEPVTAPGGDSGAGAQTGVGIDPGVMGRRLDASTAELEIDGLRPYREGAPASRIHWPSVARHGEMLERRLIADLDSAPLIVVDPSGAKDGEWLDMAVRAAGSLCVHLAHEGGGCSVLLPGDRRPIEIGHDTGAWPNVHVRLALIEAGAPPPASSLGPRGGAVMWVTGADLRSAPRALERLPAGARIVVSPSALTGVRPLFEVAGCTGCLVERARRSVAA